MFFGCFSFFWGGWKSSALHVMERFLICTGEKKTAAAPRSQLNVPLERIQRLQGLLDGNATRTRLQLYINAEMLPLLGDCFLGVFNSRSCCCHAFHPPPPSQHDLKLESRCRIQKSPRVMLSFCQYQRCVPICRHDNGLFFFSPSGHVCPSLGCH